MDPFGAYAIILTQQMLLLQQQMLIIMKRQMEIGASRSRTAALASLAPVQGENPCAVCSGYSIPDQMGALPRCRC